MPEREISKLLIKNINNFNSEYDVVLYIQKRNAQLSISKGFSIAKKILQQKKLKLENERALRLQKRF